MSRARPACRKTARGFALPAVRLRNSPTPTAACADAPRAGTRRRLSRLEQDLDRRPAGVRTRNASPGRSSWVAVLDGYEMITIAHALPQYPMELSPGVGSRHPAFYRRRPRHPQHLRRRAPAVALGLSPTVHQFADQRQGNPQVHHRRPRQGLRRDAPGHEGRRLRARGGAEALRRPRRRRAAGHRHARRSATRSISRCCRRRQPISARS